MQLVSFHDSWCGKIHAMALCFSLQVCKNQLLGICLSALLLPRQIRTFFEKSRHAKVMDAFNDP